MTIQDDMLAAGIEIDHHESDLYVPDTPEARAILARHNVKVNAWCATTFICRKTGEPYLDIPFAYCENNSQTKAE